MPVPERPPRLNRWLLLAGAINIVGMLLVISGIVRLTPTTMMLSVGGGGALLTIALVIYLANVAYDLRKRNLL